MLAPTSTTTLRLPLDRVHVPFKMLSKRLFRYGRSPQPSLSKTSADGPRRAFGIAATRSARHGSHSGE
eukprot:4274605-Prymnesium_polylepis.2